MKYKILSFREASELGFSLDYNPEWDRYRMGVFKMENGKPIRMLGHDGGEPEDQTLGRDWNWVCGALNEAYEEGQNNSK